MIPESDTTYINLLSKKGKKNKDVVDLALGELMANFEKNLGFPLKKKNDGLEEEKEKKKLENI